MWLVLWVTSDNEVFNAHAFWLHRVRERSSKNKSNLCSWLLLLRVGLSGLCAKAEGLANEGHFTCGGKALSTVGFLFSGWRIQLRSIVASLSFYSSSTTSVKPRADDTQKLSSTRAKNLPFWLLEATLVGQLKNKNRSKSLHSTTNKKQNKITQNKKKKETKQRWLVNTHVEVKFTKNLL